MKYAAESIFPGHPDKLCDAIADALVEEAAGRESRALCGIEVAVHRASVYITGRIACAGAEEIPIETIVRRCYEEAGYGADWQPAGKALRIKADLCLGPLEEGEGEFRAISDDQSIVTGYAVDSPSTNWLPVEHWLVRQVSRRLEQLRQEGPELGLGPDGKVVLIHDERTGTAEAVSVSLQQRIGGDEIALRRAVLAALAPFLPAGAQPDVYVNGAGNFEVGGPEGDNGLSGKKLVVDAYGPRVPIGGGAISGKDFFKADRAGALLSRRLAKAAVICGAARECTATLAIFPGDRAFRVVSLRSETGAELDPERWRTLVDLSLEQAGERWGKTPNLPHLARHGHFMSGDWPWERLSL